ncbi:hypothetical protein GCM10029976_062580 [Kribbella albertanoniae]
MATHSLDRVEQPQRVPDITDQVLGLHGGEGRRLDRGRRSHNPVRCRPAQREGLGFLVFDGHEIQRTESYRQLGVSFPEETL